MNKKFLLQLILASSIVMAIGFIGVNIINHSKESEQRKMLFQKINECSGEYISQNYEKSAACYQNLIISFNKHKYYLDKEQEILIEYIKSLYGSRNYVRAKEILDEAQQKKYKKPNKQKELEFLELEKIVDKKLEIIKNSKMGNSANLNFNFEKAIVSEDVTPKRRIKKQTSSGGFGGSTIFGDMIRRCVSNLNDKQCDAANDCFKNLIDLHSHTSEFQKIETMIRTGYAESLLCVLDYEDAKKEFEYVVSHEKENQKMIESAKNNLAYIEQEIGKIQDKKQAEKNDYGDYLNGTEIPWASPKALTVYIEQSPYQDFAKNAFRMWDSGLGNVVGFKYVYTPAADITLKFTTKNLKTAGNHAAGLAHMTYKKNKIAHSDIEVGLINPNTNKYHTRKEIYNIALHEIGHALGAHHSDRKNDIMYPSTDTYRDVDLSQRDLNTILKLYK